MLRINILSRASILALTGVLLGTVPTSGWAMEEENREDRESRSISSMDPEIQKDTVRKKAVALSQEIYELPTLENAVTFFKLFYNHRKDLNGIEGKNVFKLMTTLLLVETFSLEETMQYLKMYTYWYGKAGEKTKFPQKARQTVKHLIEQIGGKEKEFVKDYIDPSLFDETKENS